MAHLLDFDYIMTDKMEGGLKLILTSRSKSVTDLVSASDK